MKTKLRVVLFCSLILLLLFITTIRSIWNANYSQIPLLPNLWSSHNTDDKVESDEIGEGGIVLWRTWHSWVQTDGTLYTSDQAASRTMSRLLRFLSLSRILSVSAATQGSQLRLSFLLEGGQRAVFRPQRYPRGHLVQEAGNKGADRHNGEVAAFHLARILGITRVPPVVGRRINLDFIKSISAPSLADTIYRDAATQHMCVYGMCHYCTPSDPACGEGDTLEGSLTLWVPDRFLLRSLKHPCWNREFRCRRELLKSHPFSAGPALMDLTETAVFDFLIGNMDRHHLEVFAENFATNHLILLDNGKSFGNPFRDDFQLLKPIQQICKFRNSTYQALLSVSGTLSTLMRASMGTDPISPVLSADHLTALDRRVGSAIDIIQQCTQEHGDSVFNPKETPADNQSDLRAQLAEASSEDSDLETETDENTTQHIPIPFVPTSQDTISSTLSGTSCPRDTSPTHATHENTAINKQRLCLLVVSHSLVFILGLYIGARFLLSRRLYL